MTPDQPPVMKMERLYLLLLIVDSDGNMRLKLNASWVISIISNLFTSYDIVVGVKLTVC